MSEIAKMPFVPIIERHLFAKVTSQMAHGVLL